MPDQKSSAEQILGSLEPWSEGLLKLRAMILSAGLREEIKWGAPTYYYQGKKIMAIFGFKNYFSIWFHQGVFLSDPAGVLVNAGEGRTRGLRQWRFASVSEIKPTLVRSYIQEAIRNAEAGKEIKPEKKASIAMPKEMAAAWKKDKTLAKAFSSLTPGRQREYLEYIAEAKTEPTRLRRLEKSIPLILEGKGLNDRFK